MGHKVSLLATIRKCAQVRGNNNKYLKIRNIARTCLYFLMNERFINIAPKIKSEYKDKKKSSRAEQNKNGSYTRHGN